MGMGNSIHSPRLEGSGLGSSASSVQVTMTLSDPAVTANSTQEISMAYGSWFIRLFNSMSVAVASSPGSAHDAMLSAEVVSQAGAAQQVDMLWVARLENARVAYTLLSTLYSGKKNEVLRPYVFTFTSSNSPSLPRPFSSLLFVLSIVI